MFSPGRRIRNRSNFRARNAARPRYSPYAYEEWIILIDSDSDDVPLAAEVDEDEEEEVNSQPITKERCPVLEITNIASPGTETKVRTDKTPNLELALAVDVVKEQKADAMPTEAKKVECESANGGDEATGEECIPVVPIGRNEEPVEQQTKDFLIGWG